ncbi:undecaprenyl-diphosphate phosphatase [Jeotgalibacillus salarius]|uniref:Undecaprenyl-diphosphatase n=1 Tax=Jeotgalibacillus salarius TaxID=546023 RepID=A0A4Y8LMM2_9BACL|nr:undecaprenyl-diphosphate phosphatase [Jeotgalibacillus salarius]TFE03843.1 UDP pyrophosphate phosphatase [Jeotgalibacillus salarius]
MNESDFIYLIKIVIIGLVQGLTEPIPVSSSGHVMIASELLGLGEQGFTFVILTNTASLIAILMIYRRDIIRLIVNSISYLKTKESDYKNDFQFIRFLILATFPAGILGLLLNDFIAEQTSMTTIALMLFMTGIALWLIKDIKGRKDEGDIYARDSLLVGFGQSLALIPGISRSGATIISSIAVGMNQDTALRFSFLLYIPISLAGVVLGLSNFVNEPDKSNLAAPYLLAFFTTLLMTYIAMKWFISVLKNGKLLYFSYYCFIVGTLLFMFY